MALPQKRSNKGQTESTTPAAILVIVILAVTLLYILFMDPDDRNELLNITTSGNGNGNGEAVVNAYKTFLQEQPGNIYAQIESSYKHTIPEFYLYQKSQGLEVADWSSIYVSSSLFSKRTKSLDLYINNPNYISDSYITFNVKKSKGILEIALNGELIYEGISSLGTINPIKIPTKLLKDSNTLDFSVVSPGLAFWETNEYVLENIRVVANQLTIEDESSANFFVYENEISDPKRATLKFYADCTQSQMSSLYVTINSVKILNTVPSCGDLNMVEFSPQILRIGDNNIAFNSNSNAKIREITVDIEANDQVNPTYYFNMNDTEYGYIINGSKKVYLYLEFLGEDNKLDININSNKLYIDGDEFVRKDITSFIKKTGNYVELIPRKNMRVNFLSVYIN